MKLILYLGYILFTSYTAGTVNPLSYILGPGDTILIVSKTTGSAIKTVVSPDGNVPIYSYWVQGSTGSTGDIQTREGATLLITALINGKGLTLKQFSDSLGCYSGKFLGKRDSFKVILIAPRLVSVEVDGAVYHPGIYTLPANYTIADALWSAGGLSGSACFSNITLISSHDTTKVNLGSFESLNNSEVNRNISSVQKIFVPFIKKDSSIYVVGDISTHPLASPVFLPLHMEDNKEGSHFPVSLRTRAISLRLSEGVEVNSILEKIIGENSTNKLLSRSVFVKRNGSLKQVKDPSFEIIPGDSLFIFPLFRGVLVSGEVSRPGALIPFTEGASVEYYISRAGGKTQFAGPVKIMRGFRYIKVSKTTIPEDGDVIVVGYSRTKRFAEYVSILQGLITLLTLYLAYSR